MKRHTAFFFFITHALIAPEAFADGFSAPSGTATYSHSLALQRYVQDMSHYQPQSAALKQRVHNTINYYKKIHILKSINKGSYTVDCIPFREQPALINQPDLAQSLLPAVRQHTQNNLHHLTRIGAHFDFNPTTQCPLGSVALLRPSKTMLTSEQANKKVAPGNMMPQQIHAGYSYELGADNTNNLVSIQTQASQAYFKGPQNQYVVSTNDADHSLDQFWFVNRTYQESVPTYSVEFGIIASAYFTTPASTSIFVFASVDDYGSNSCYNLECSNFVQFPNTPVLGSPTDTRLDYIFQVTHTTLNQYLNSPAYYLTLLSHDASSNSPNNSASVLLGYYADSIYPSPTVLPQYFSAGSEVYALEPNNGTLMYGNYMEPYIGYTGPLHIEFSTENANSFPYFTSNGPSPYGLIWHLGQED